MIAGSGDKAFSAGGDMKFLNDRKNTSSPEVNHNEMIAFYKRFLSVRQLPVPVIAAINGHAVGAGLCFAMACDYRLVSAKAKLGFNFTRLAIHPGMAATHFLPKLIGAQNATWLLTSGILISGEEAVKMGLAAELCETVIGKNNCFLKFKIFQSEKTIEKAMERAKLISEASASAVRQTLKTLRLQQESELEQLSRVLHFFDTFPKSFVSRSGCSSSKLCSS